MIDLPYLDFTLTIGVLEMGENKEYITCPDEKGSINISEEVVAVIVASAAMEVDGVAGLSVSPGKEVSDTSGKKALLKGVKIRVEDNTIQADVFVTVESGSAISQVGSAVQDAVKTAVEASAGISVSEVNVHICGVSFGKKVK